MVQVNIDPGGSTGWHSHPGGAIVIIKQGSVTSYDSQGGHCDIQTYSAGQAFIERPGVVHKVVNTGTIPVINMVVFPRVLPDGAFRIDEADPGTCPGQ
jgi:quercetin dioxygenase-like cupin family protein